MPATIGIFLGGAGVFMIAAGHPITSTSVLVAVGLVSAAYLMWFLGFGPGATVPPPPTAVRRTRRRRVDEESFRAIATRPGRCSFCGIVDHDTNRVRAADEVAICERCIAAAVPELSPYWALRTGLVTGDSETG